MYPWLSRNYHVNQAGLGLTDPPATCFLPPVCHVCSLDIFSFYRKLSRKAVMLQRWGGVSHLCPFSGLLDRGETREQNLGRTDAHLILYFQAGLQTVLVLDFTNCRVIFRIHCTFLINSKLNIRCSVFVSCCSVVL